MPNVSTGKETAQLFAPWHFPWGDFFCLLYVPCDSDSSQRLVNNQRSQPSESVDVVPDGDGSNLSSTPET